MASSPVIKEGPLLMHHSGMMSTSWNPCYFSLQRAYLHVYATKNSATPVENIVRSSITRAGQYGQPSLFRFEVEFSRRSKMILQASSEIGHHVGVELSGTQILETLEVKQWVHALMWHLLPADVRDTVPTENETYGPHDPPAYGPHDPPAYDDVVQENSNWSCCIF